jgi:hypothetical protein
LPEKEPAVSLLTSTPTMIAIRRRLRAAVNGRIITPGNVAYDQARTVFYGGFDHHPALIVRPADAGEVAQVVSIARERGLELADLRALDIDPNSAPPGPRPA